MNIGSRYFNSNFAHHNIIVTRGVSWGGFGGLGPPGSPKGRQKERKKKRKRKERERGKNRKKEEKEGNKKKKREERERERERERARKKKERKLNQYDERGAMQFQVQAGAPGKKTSGAPN